MSRPAVATYGEMRSNAEKIRDELVKERVIAGMEVLKEEYGEDWVEHINPRTFRIRHGSACVLGQVYNHAVYDEAAWEYAADKLGYSSIDANSETWYDLDGYSRGLAILDGDVLDHPGDYGFFDDEEVNFDELQDAWMLVFTGEEA